MSGKVNASKIRAAVYPGFTKNNAGCVVPKSLTRGANFPSPI